MSTCQRRAGDKGLEGGGKGKGGCARVTCAAPLLGRGVGDRCGISATSGMERQVHCRRREVVSKEADELAGIRRTSCEGEGEGAGPPRGLGGNLLAYFELRRMFGIVLICTYEGTCTAKFQLRNIASLDIKGPV